MLVGHFAVATNAGQKSRRGKYHQTDIIKTQDDREQKRERSKRGKKEKTRSQAHGVVYYSLYRRDQRGETQAMGKAMSNLLISTPRKESTTTPTFPFYPSPNITDLPRGVSRLNGVRMRKTSIHAHKRQRLPEKGLTQACLLASFDHFQKLCICAVQGW